ncbi:glycosyltransferase [Intrasporangium oryzae]|uniref:glycosyltransferase n=1 Tax=Intrasporangium oryzae TaxID=412687 RepID=UPI0004AEC4F4|nr:nucleotide disphospho-sugar-binding domain-containing protein [Intrasporangium oryzae]
MAGADYAPLVTEAGCTFVPIDAPMTPPDDATGVRAYLDALRRYMDAGASAALSALDARAGFDVVLTNAISRYGHDIAEHLGVPSAAALLQPAEPSAAYPPMRLPRESRAAAQRRRRSTGLPVHHGISPAVLPRPEEWSERLTLDGFWWSPTRAGWEAPDDLSAFLDAGTAPIVVTLGSLPPGGETTAQIERALRPGGHRVILQGDVLSDAAAHLAGDLGPERVLHVGDVPHEWLLPRAAAVVHQAGAGVTSSALRAGTPSVPVPTHTDQPFWARRLGALSAGTAPVPMKRLTADALATRLGEATSSKALRDGAAQVARALAAEDGTMPLRSWLRRLAV